MSRPIKSAQPPPAPSLLGWSWQLHPQSADQEPLRKSHANGRSDWWKTGMARLISNSYWIASVGVKLMCCTFMYPYPLVSQGGSPRVPSEEERVREVSGEPRGRAGKPEQNPHRGTESPQRLVLPQIRVEYTCRWLDRWSPALVYRDSAQSHASGCALLFSTLLLSF